MTDSWSSEKQALHRYFLWADRMHAHYLASGLPPTDKSARRLWLIRTLPYMSIWLSYLHVLSEGWAELRMKDPIVDQLLQSKNLSVLRRFRNGTFHFQRVYFDQRFTNFLLDTDGSLAWAGELHAAFSNWFLEQARRAGFDPSLDVGLDEDGDAVHDA